MSSFWIKCAAKSCRFTEFDESGFLKMWKKGMRWILCAVIYLPVDTYCKMPGNICLFWPWADLRRGGRGGGLDPPLLRDPTKGNLQPIVWCCAEHIPYFIPSTHNDNILIFSLRVGVLLVQRANRVRVWLPSPGQMFCIFYMDCNCNMSWNRTKRVDWHWCERREQAPDDDEVGDTWYISIQQICLNNFQKNFSSHAYSFHGLNKTFHLFCIASQLRISTGMIQTGLICLGLGFSK